ncbi:sugar phosphate isomerase/epimerase [Allocatelliglobosispora scoriae]|uniref:Sugar phosphate isomerase/epimerase n=1 Tax=Allocatelliglobosispora scoriae TaxID=643052 RepID=A0A841BKR3_9ACTN|nr:metabolite traffic protein EboE [Allocatelliglobosispora scoriae]MBB5869687.1 sugar phosphate isomerase/epimerase [Allocatelliglobosispora scoriae]
MRLHHRDGQTVHLAYGTNVRPAADLPGILAQLDGDAVIVRERLGVDRLGLGLWLSAPVAGMLAASARLRQRLGAELTARGLEVVTLNGFPYRAPTEQRPVPEEPAGRLAPAKRALYRPDWTSPERLEYTLDLARVLCDLMPPDAERGSVSTVPIAWREPWDGKRADRAYRLMEDLADGLAEITWQTGRLVRVGFEPEPGCLIETTTQAVDYLADIDPAFLGICIDLAHLACVWESPEAAIETLTTARLPIVKVQLSSALVADDPHTAIEALRGFAGTRFPHPARTPSGAGTDDLEDAVTDDLPGPWRVHLHVPLHTQPPPPLTSTLPVVRAALAELLGGLTARTDQLEVETATWGVRAFHEGASHDDVIDSVVAEMEFARAELRRLGVGGAVSAEGQIPAPRQGESAVRPAAPTGGDPR